MSRTYEALDFLLMVLLYSLSALVVIGILLACVTMVMAFFGWLITLKERSEKRERKERLS